MQIWQNDILTKVLLGELVCLFTDVYEVYIRGLAFSKKYNMEIDYILAKGALGGYDKFGGVLT